MKFKKGLFIIGIVLIMLLSVSMVSATDDANNITEVDETSNDMELESSDLVENDIVQNDDILSTNDDSDLLSSTLSVKTTITVDSVTYNEGDSFTFNAKVKASNNMVVSGDVTFKHDKEFTRTLDSKGQTKISFIGNKNPGKYEWTASYNGGSVVSGGNTYKFLTSTTKFYLTVMGSAVLTTNNSDFYYNSGEKFKINVINNYMDRIPANKKIKAYILDSSGNSVINDVYTNNDGICEVELQYPSGNYTIYAMVDDEYYRQALFSFNVTINKSSVKLTPVNAASTFNSNSVLKVNVVDEFGNNVNEGIVTFKINGNSYDVNVKNGVATKKITLPKTGNYNYEAIFFSENYNSSNISSKIQVNKANVKLTAYKWISTTKSSATLKAIVKDTNGKKVKVGTVRFKVNGKTYSVKVKNGVATKNIKLKKAKTYSYKATFSNKNYKTKTVSSKIYVKKAKKYYTIKYGKYSGKITYKQYLKVLNAKNKGKYAIVTVKTGKYKVYKDPIYKKVKVKKTKWVYKKVLRSEYWSWDGGSEWEDYDDWEYYTDNGWTWYGTVDKDKSYSDGSYYSAHYYKLKKKVKYTTTKKVKTGKYKTTKYPYRISLETIEKDGLYYKGDYISVWADDPGISKKVNLYTLKV